MFKLLYFKNQTWSFTASRDSVPVDAEEETPSLEKPFSTECFSLR